MLYQELYLGCSIFSSSKKEQPFFYCQHLINLQGCPTSKRSKYVRIKLQAAKISLSLKFIELRLLMLY